MGELDMSMQYHLAAGSKRSRDEIEEVSHEDEGAWTLEEEETIRATLMHPFRPISTPYPPGSLPPAQVLDELANQILTYALRPTHGSPSSRMQNTSGISGWLRSFDATRARLFAVALAESKFGHDASERKLSRVERKERQQRPGLRRMDSMDFLDEAEGEKEELSTGDGIGKALRLSTSLQNSAKASIPRSMSYDDLSAGPSTPSSTTITLTPSSPGPSPAPQPILHRRGSFRSTATRTTRPTSLLQRGRSFTASDLQAEEASLTTPPPPPLPSQELASSPEPNITTPELLHAPKSLDLPRSRNAITRSQSTSVLCPEGHLARDTFLAHSPSSEDRHTLAIPLDIGRSSKSKQAQGAGWTDSDDEPTHGQGNRVVKKSKSIRPKSSSSRSSRSHVPHMQRITVVGGLQGGFISGDEGLRSPFEEKDGLDF
ncbi:hypothetical protein BCR39DRAFT_286940 [Naematelia encephala]|uniref:Uncharacterized protein n=1 Tax=Naematelia encephala TaxID=71784 RepID=A0A1Y2ASB8_9TREE|nr:hypothetical protein BCR39DRAFT_286940 [Naematelia encephala]